MAPDAETLALGVEGKQVQAERQRNEIAAEHCKNSTAYDQNGCELSVQGQRPLSMQAGERSTEGLRVHGKSGKKAQKEANRNSQARARSSKHTMRAWNAGSSKDAPAVALPKQPERSPLMRPVVHASGSAMHSRFVQQQSEEEHHVKGGAGKVRALEDAEDQLRGMLASRRCIHESLLRTALRILASGLQDKKMRSPDGVPLNDEGQHICANTPRSPSRSERAQRDMSERKRRHHPDATGVTGYSPTTDSDLRFKAPASEEADVGRAAWIDEMVMLMGWNARSAEPGTENSSAHRFTMTRSELSDAFRQGGIALDEDGIQALCSEYRPSGSNRTDEVDAERLIYALLQPPARGLSKGKPIEGPLRSEAGASQAEGRRIHFYPCRKGVFAPSNFSDAQLKASTHEPSERLKVSRVFGLTTIASGDTGNVFYADTQGADAIFAAAKTICIMQTKQGGQQRFLFGHNDDVSCLCVNKMHKVAASGQLGKQPSVKIWDLQSGRCLCSLLCDEGDRQVVTLGMDHSSSILAAISGNNRHSLTVWDTKRKRRIFRCPTVNGKPPQVFGIRFLPGSADFVTFGVKHLKLWERSGDSFSPKSAVFGEFGKQDVLCCEFLTGAHLSLSFVYCY